MQVNAGLCEMKIEAELVSLRQSGSVILLVTMNPLVVNNQCAYW